MTNMQAAIVPANLNKQVFLLKKIEIQKKFVLKLKNLKKINFPKINKQIRHSHWLTYFRVKILKKIKI